MIDSFTEARKRQIARLEGVKPPTALIAFSSDQFWKSAGVSLPKARRRSLSRETAQRNGKEPPK
jgi:hypothetical protein